MKLVRRDRMKIYWDILSTVRSEGETGEVVLTRVQLRTNVPYDRLKVYLAELKELNMIQNELSPRLTERGLEFVADYEKVLDFMKRMGLAYS
jgi:predicted transcriptional regulator